MNPLNLGTVTEQHGLPSFIIRHPSQSQMINRCSFRAREPLSSLLSPPSSFLPRRSLSNAGKGQPDERLRILFCGSEQFSAYSLQALAKYARSAESEIESIDVVTRKDKLVGRGLKQTRSPEIKKVAEELQLPLHQIDTFTGWAPPSYSNNNDAPSAVNLIVAVSFGLLVPPRILRGVTYGGLNVHPSLLPQLKGAAPIQWTILHGMKMTGVTLQTLHESKFDEGVVLDQALVPIEHSNNTSFKGLRDQLGPIGADLLIKGLREKRYISQDPISTTSTSERFSYAPKLEKRHMAMSPEIHSARQILRMCQALGAVWAHTQDLDGKAVRVTTNGLTADSVFSPANSDFIPREVTEIATSIPVGVPYGIISYGQQPQNSKAPLLLNTVEKSLAIHTLTVSGTAPGHALASAAKGRLLRHHTNLKTTTETNWDVYTFCTPLHGEVGSLPAISESF